MPPPPPIYKPAARHSSRMLTSTSTICFSPAPLGKLAVQDPPLARPRRRTQLADGAPHIHFLLAAQILCIPPLAADDMLERQQGGLSIPPEREGGSSQCPARTNLRDRRCPDCVPTGEQDFDDPRPDEVAGVGDAQGGGGHRALTPSPFFLSGRWCRQANGFVRERANRGKHLSSGSGKKWYSVVEEMTQDTSGSWHLKAVALAQLAMHSPNFCPFMVSRLSEYGVQGLIFSEFFVAIFSVHVIRLWLKYCVNRACVLQFYSCVVQLRSRCYQVPPCLSSINTAYQRAIPLYGGHSRRAR
jgi:hypothetical protein